MIIAVLLVVLWLVTRLGADGGSASADDSPVSVTEPGAGTLGPTPSAGSTDPARPGATVPPPAASGAAAPGTTPSGTTPSGATSSGATPSGATPSGTAAPGTPAPARLVPTLPCKTEELELAVTADTARYAPDVKPKLSLTVGTSEAAACTRDFGPDALGLVITSGQDRIWGSQDCSSAPTDVRVLTPGTPVTLEMTWDRVRSQPGCAPTGSVARPGYYVVTPVAGKLTGQQTSFLLD